jgi:hypothetical protein
MSFFQSNPDLYFSRDDSFVHINRHCEELELGNFFRAPKDEGGMGYEFECKEEWPLEREILMVGRSSILRGIKNLEKTHILEKNEERGHTRYRWVKNSATEALNQLATITRTQEDYRRFMEGWGRRLQASSRVDIQEIVGQKNMKAVVYDYLEDLSSNWKVEGRRRIPSKMARLSYFCQINSVSYSTAKQEWKHKFKDEISRRSENIDDYQNLVELCIKLGDDTLAPVKAGRFKQILDSFQKIGTH